MTRNDNNSWDIESASLEISDKSYSQIQYETAFKWGSRAVAAYLKSLESEDLGESFGWLELGNEYAHEAIEHSALVEDGGELVGHVSSTISEYKNAAVTALFGSGDQIAESSEEQEKQNHEDSGKSD